jgi:lipoprotein-anchoring transpeptidase ErfK/SrfK
MRTHLRPILVLLALLAGTGTGVAAAQRAPLYWVSAPPSGAHLSVRGDGRQAFVVKAAAADPRTKVRLSLLGSSPARLAGVAGNPATGVISIRSSAPARDFTVTLVARTVGPGSIAITRTVLLTVQHREVSLVGPHGVSRWAYVLQATDARSAPVSSAPIVTKVPTATSDGKPNLVLALAEQQDARGSQWIRVRLSTLPNSRAGWIPRTQLSALRTVATRLVVNTSTFELSFYRRGKLVFRAPVGVGRSGSPTPRGQFYIREKLTDFHNPFYGPIAFGTSARSEVLTDWPGGGVVGIHGTNQPQLIPGRISHGCIRLRNNDIVKLARVLPLGTPVVVR